MVPIRYHFLSIIRKDLVVLMYESSKAFPDNLGTHAVVIGKRVNI